MCVVHCSQYGVSPGPLNQVPLRGGRGLLIGAIRIRNGVAAGFRKQVE